MKILYTLRKNFRSQNFNKLAETAYHEAGHTCFSYFAKFKVDRVSISADMPGNGTTFVSYAEDQDIVNALFDLNKTAVTFNKLPYERKTKSKAVAFRLTHSLVAGPLAEARYISLEREQTNMHVILEHSDLMMCKTIETSLNNILTHYQISQASPHTTNEIKRVSIILSLPQIWNSIDEIVKKY